MHTKFVAAALLASVCAAPVLASTSDAAPLGLLDLRFASVESGVTTQLQLPVGGQRNYIAGNYNFETRVPAGSFLGYCVDPFQWANGSFRSYEAMPLAEHLAPLSERYANVTRLFGHAYQDSLLSAVKAAGFQLALWETFNDDGNLTMGAVRTTANTNGAVTSEAQALLSALPTWSGTGTAYELTFYASAGYQDYLAVTGLASGSMPPIPEPGNYALMLAGLGLLGWSAGRRKPHR